MTAEVETMAYAGNVPWHGLGVPVNDDMSPEEILIAAGLDWTVETRPLIAKIDSHEIPIESHRALIRSRWSGEDPVRILAEDSLGICGPSYVPTQNQEAIDFYSRFCKAGSMTMETCGSLMGGRQIFALAKIKESFVLPGDDLVESYLLMSHPHIWGKSLSIMYTPIRVVCMNTLMMAMSGAIEKFRAPHIQTFDKDIQEKAVQTLRLAKMMSKEFNDQAKFLSRKKCTDNDVVIYAAHLFDRSLSLAVEGDMTIAPNELNRSAWQVRTNFSKSPGAQKRSAKGTWWGALNAVTYYVDHEAGRERDTALTSAWFGARAAKKRQALELALKMAA